MRYALDIVYDGTEYSGWQIQPNAVTIQQRINEALSTALREPTFCAGAGRTDAGVHASQLIAHFDGPETLPPRFFHSLNGILPQDIGIKAIYRPQKAEFHARFDAVSRAYIYQLVFRKPVLERRRVMWVRHPVDLSVMQRAAVALLDYDSFGAFCKTQGGNKTNFCRIMHAYFKEEGETLQLHIKADRFLRGMVRAIVGTLLLIGKGDMTVEEMRQVILSEDRTQAGPNAEARGLTLTEVNYPDGYLGEPLVP